MTLKHALDAKADSLNVCNKLITNARNLLMGKVVEEINNAISKGQFFVKIPVVKNTYVTSGDSSGAIASVMQELKDNGYRVRLDFVCYEGIEEKIMNYDLNISWSI